MKFKIPNELLAAAGKHAAERGMSLEEYIQEALGMLTDEQIKYIVDVTHASSYLI